jgi:DNA-binding CsgD family transcriptional regulator
VLLVERHRELEVLADCHARAARGDGRLVVLTGAAGTGKTALLRAFADRLSGAGADVRVAVGSAAERDQPFGVLAQLLRAAREPRWSELLARAATGPREAGIRRIGEELAESAAGSPLVLAVDDSRHADGESLAVLAHVVRRLPELPLLVVLTEPAVPAGRPELASGLPRHPVTRQVRVAPLSEAGVAQVLAGAFGPAAARLAPGCHELTGGNPLLVRAVVDELTGPATPAGRVPERLAPGDGFGLAVLACLPPGTRDLACAVAVLGESADPGRVARLAGTLPSEVDKAVRALTAAGLLAGDRFRHPALGAAVVDHLPAGERADLHTAAARLLYEEGADAAEVAAHLAEAGPVAEPWAAAVLCDAAAEASLADDPALARERLRVAQRWCADPADLAVVALTRVVVDSRVDPATARRQLTPLVTAARAGRLAGGDVLKLVTHLVWHGRLADAAACLAVVDSTDSRVSAMLHAARAWLEHTCPALLAGTRGETAPAPAILVSRRGRAVEVLRAVLADGAPEHASLVAEELLSGLTLADDDGLAAAESALLALIYAGRAAVAVPYCVAWLAEATERGVPTWIAVLAGIRALAAQQQGDPVTAERYARSALAAISADGWGVAVAAPLAVLVWAASETGRVEDAAAWLNHPVPPAAFQTRYGPLYLHARGEYHLAVGRLLAAAKDFADCGNLVRRWGIDSPAYVPWRSSAAEVHLALNEPVTAKELVAEQTALPGAAVARARAITLRVTAATRTPKERPALLQEALTSLARVGDKSESVRVLAELAQVFRDVGLTGRARTTARRAWELARASGVESLCDRRWSADLKAHLHVVEDEAPAEPAVPLTDSELAVARLAALEHTNREISRKMHITVSTVEQHLTRVYRKLGVSGRKQIALVLRMNIADSA